MLPYIAAPWILWDKKYIYVCIYILYIYYIYMMVKKINNPWPPLASAGTGALQRALGSGRGGEEDRERRQEDPA